MAFFLRFCAIANKPHSMGEKIIKQQSRGTFSLFFNFPKISFIYFETNAKNIL